MLNLQVLGKFKVAFFGFVCKDWDLQIMGSVNIEFLPISGGVVLSFDGVERSPKNYMTCQKTLTTETWHLSEMDCPI